MLYYMVERGREIVMCAAVSVMLYYMVERGREMVMFAAVSIMVCYRVGETKGNAEVCCS